MNVIQSVLLPSGELADSEELYVKGTYIIDDKGCLIVNEGESVSFATYFNTFAIEKWSKYTSLSDLHLCGHVDGEIEITVVRQYCAGDVFVNKNVVNERINGDFAIDISSCIGEKGILSYQIKAICKSSIERIAFSTEDQPRDIRIGCNICTFRREEYIYRLFNMYKESSFKDRLHLFISDNGSSLDRSKLSSDNVHVVNNKNYGGASGFARGIYEIRKYNSQHQNEIINYNIMMDDDIYIDIRLFERLFAFLGLIKEEYDSYFIAGAMLSLDQPYWQYEKYASWRGNTFIQSKPNLDLREDNNIVYNEMEDHLLRCSVGWWFCCVNTKMLNVNNYPFPCFFRGDDMEFAIRNNSKIITLNGVCVWHEPFYKKYSIVNEDYYLLRNTLVINALYYPEIRYKQMKKYLIKKFMRAIFTYHYRSGELIIKAIEDYMKGISFFANTDAEALNNELRKMNYVAKDVNEYLVEWSRFDLINEINSHGDKSKARKLFRYITLNGLLLHKVFYKEASKAFIGFGNKYTDFYLRRNVLNYDLFEDKAYITHCSKREAYALLFRMKKTLGRYRRSFDAVKEGYQKEFYKLQTEDFWKEYLAISD